MILLIDDEPEYISNYISALKDSGYKTELILDVDAVQEFISIKLHEINAVILDIMMPYGESFSSERTNGGTRTGNLLYDMIRKDLPNVPVFVLTNVTDHSVEEKFADEKNCYFFKKGKPSTFIEHFKLIISR